MSCNATVYDHIRFAYTESFWLCLLNTMYLLNLFLRKRRQDFILGGGGPNRDDPTCGYINGQNVPLIR